MKSKKVEIDADLLKSSLIKLSKEEPEFLLVIAQNSNKEAISKINNLSERLDNVVNILKNNSENEIHDMNEFKNSHRIKKEYIEQLQELWKNEPPIGELIKSLN